MRTVVNQTDSPMTVEQKMWTKKDGWTDGTKNKGSVQNAQLVFVFGGREESESPEHFATLKGLYPDAHIVSCSTAGEILGTKVSDHSLSVTAIHFDTTTLAFSQTRINSSEESEAKGKELAGALPHEGLVHAMVFSDGLLINGSALVSGLTSILPKSVSVTGGLVGDGPDFKKTVVGLDAVPTEGNIILIGFYGSSLKVGYGSFGGWDTFGLERTITRSKGNVLFELDNKPALTLYKEYLGEQAAGLPSTGLLFPMKLDMKSDTDASKVEVVRTLLGINEADQSMTFAGDMPMGVHATLMKANFDRIIDGAHVAATASSELMTENVDLAILISCIGRKLVLKERIEEETEAVQSVFGENVPMAGFYSYGEICPVTPTENQCRLHNQTMTITTFKES